MSEEEEEIIVPQKSSAVPMLGGLIGGVLIGMGVGFGLWGGAPEAPAAEEPPPGVPAPIETEIVEIDPFSINMVGTSRVLRLGVHVEIPAEKKEDFDKLLPALRHEVIAIASDYTPRELQGAQGKRRLRDELHARFSSVLGDVGMRQLFFSEFVVQ